MLSNLIFVFLGLAVAQEFNYPDPPVPCGADIGLCPSDDQFCKADDTECADLTRCAGTCVFKNVFVFCGGFSIEPKPCEAGETCADDPRSPESCGMACDHPGICLSDDITECEDDSGCPEGQWCYENAKYDVPPSGKVCM